MTNLVWTAEPFLQNINPLVHAATGTGYITGDCTHKGVIEQLMHNIYVKDLIFDVAEFLAHKVYQKKPPSTALPTFYYILCMVILFLW